MIIVILIMASICTTTTPYENLVKKYYIISNSIINIKNAFYFRKVLSYQLYIFCMNEKF
jgi:hypothetical protein